MVAACALPRTLGICVATTIKLFCGRKRKKTSSMVQFEVNPEYISAAMVLLSMHVNPRKETLIWLNALQIPAKLLREWQKRHLVFQAASFCPGHCPTLRTTGHLPLPHCGCQKQRGTCLLRIRIISPCTLYISVSSLQLSLSAASGESKTLLGTMEPKRVAGAQRISTCFFTPKPHRIGQRALGRAGEFQELPRVVTSPRARHKGSASHLWTQANREKLVCFYTFPSFIRSKPASNDTNFWSIYKFPSWLAFISKSSPGTAVSSDLSWCRSWRVMMMTNIMVCVKRI